MRRSLFIYTFTAWLFVIGVVVQVFVAGMVVVAGLTDWTLHKDLGHALGLPLVVMLISMYTGRLPRDFKRLTWALFAIYFIQADIVIFLRTNAPIVSALHPVIALFDFALGGLLARRSLAFMREADLADPIT